jgi:zinc protease
MQSVREDRGLAYSVSSYFLPMREKGPFIMGLQTRTDQTEEALNILRDELEKYVAEGPTRDELEASLSNIVGGFALNLDSNSKLVSNLAMIGFYDLPLDYLETYIDNMRDVSRRDVKKVLKQRLDTSRLVTVIVGNSSGSQSAGK